MASKGKVTFNRAVKQADNNEDWRRAAVIFDARNGLDR
jgi:hypothetical protein